MSMKPPVRIHVLLFGFFLLTSHFGYAGSATWNQNPMSSDWNTASNWTPETVPNGPDDVASFASSSLTTVSIPRSTEVSQIVFNNEASSFSITVAPGVTLTLSGQGVINNSGIQQNFNVMADRSGAGNMRFKNSASAGGDTFYTINAPADSSRFSCSVTFEDFSTAGDGTFTVKRGIFAGNAGGDLDFYDQSNAGNAVITNEADPTGGAFGGTTGFLGTASAANATFFNQGCTINGSNVSGVTWFEQNSTAANATIILHGGTAGLGEPGEAIFTDTASAEDATFIADNDAGGTYGGAIRFWDTNTGSRARFELRDPGTSLDLHFQESPFTIGSIEGSGTVEMGISGIAIGANDLDTVFSGFITGFGAVTKVGKGTLVLTNANTYGRVTSVNRGTLLVNNTSGSATGSRPVTVKGGRLGGKGIIAGAVTVGGNGGNQATLSPGSDGTGLLTLQSTLTFKANGIYDWSVNSATLGADQVVANGVSIDSGATIFVSGQGNAAIPVGTLFAVIDNTAATPIAGTFANLPDGSIFTVHGTNFQANYEGGDGNDLTLTVVP